MNAKLVAHALVGARKSGAGWVACCPAHEDRRPSLSLRNANDGTLLVHCLAGCPQSAVIGELKDRGLWPERTRNLAKRIIAEYTYEDEGGKKLYQVVRTEPKGFFQRYPHTNGSWINRKHPRQVLYHLPEVLRAPIVFVCEGEKDADTLRSHGFVATTIAGGANAKWLASFTDALHGREIVMLPDNDEPGKELMRRIGTALLGNVPRLICFDDHHLVGAKDISDWFALGHSETEFVALLENTCRTR